MATIVKLVVDILEELKSLQNRPDLILDRRGDFPLPSMIPAGNAGSIIISKNMEEAMASVGSVIKNEAKLNSRFGQKDWDRAVKRAFGNALIKINLDNDSTDNADLVLKSVRETLDKWDENTRNLCEHGFGCTLFKDDKIHPFNLGPVRFESRRDWLQRKKSAGEVSTVTYGRIWRAWQGEKLKPRKISQDSRDEINIIEAIKHCTFVCSVETEGLAQEISKEKAVMAARIAMASIALIWSQPSSALNGFNLLFDGPVYSQRSLTFNYGSQLLSGYKTSHLPYGPYLKEGEWEKVCQKYENIFSVVGEVLEFYLKPLKQSARPKMMNVLFHALLWFYEGCRENVTTLAIVKLASSMDAIACGKKSKGIQSIVKAFSGKMPQDMFLADGTTTKQIVDKVYDYVRSRTLHGTNDKIGEDWSIVHGQAEQLARLCLVFGLDWAYSNATCNDPTLFFQG